MPFIKTERQQKFNNNIYKRPTKHARPKIKIKAVSNQCQLDLSVATDFI